MLKLANEKDAISLRAITKIADELGRLLSELVAFLDPEAIMVYLHPPQGKEAFLEAIKAAFYQHHSPVWGAPVKFLPAKLGGEAIIKGMIALAQEKFLSRTLHVVQFCLSKELYSRVQGFKG